MALRLVVLSVMLGVSLSSPALSSLQTQGTNGSSMSGAIEATTTTTTPATCPHSGYQLFPGYNCYKLFNDEYKDWSDAREQCRRDGGDLMVMETEQEREEAYLPLRNSAGFMYYPWVGVYIPQGEDSWMSVKGEPAPSSWWEPGLPSQDAASKCADASRKGLLRNIGCEVPGPFICEIQL